MSVFLHMAGHPMSETAVGTRLLTGGRLLNAPAVAAAAAIKVCVVIETREYLKLL